MQFLENWKHQWRNLLFTYHFIQLVTAKDGDLLKVGKLARSCNDVDSLRLMIDFLKGYPQGRYAFQECPRLGKVDLHQLHQLPNNTLGYLYAEHMLKNGLTPLQSGETSNDYGFLIAHITETHDIWHVITGSDTNIEGEIQLEAFCVAQLYASRFWLALLAKNLLKAIIFNIELSGQYMDALAKGWVMGKQAKPLFGIQWNSLWETPIEDIRHSFNLSTDAVKKVTLVEV
jgi:ubiquinone biosynthesis protein COQ4